MSDIGVGSRVWVSNSNLVTFGESGLVINELDNSLLRVKLDSCSIKRKDSVVTRFVNYNPNSLTLEEDTKDEAIEENLMGLLFVVHEINNSKNPLKQSYNHPYRFFGTKCEIITEVKEFMQDTIKKFKGEYNFYLSIIKQPQQVDLVIKEPELVKVE